MRAAALALVLSSVAGCGGGMVTDMLGGADGPTALPPALPTCSAALPGSSKAATTTIENAGACSEMCPSLALAASDAIVPDGLVALGDAVTFSGACMFPHGADLVLPADLAKGPAGAPEGDIVVVEKRASGAVQVVSVSNVLYEAPYHRLHIHVAELGTYQAAIPQSAGQMITRHIKYRAIGGASMGGMGSSLNGFTHPDRYDGIAVMGADPGPDLTYSLGLLHDWFFSGFCTVADQAADPTHHHDVGMLCPSTRKPMVDQNERAMDFEHLPYQSGQGTALTSNRAFWLRAFRDVTRAFGNPGYASDPKDLTPTGIYFPPGVPASTATVSNADACGPKHAVLKNFYDGKYNPDGSLPVITFCDGGDSAALGLGVFDPSLPQKIPAQIILAVDVNNNGKRDSGEPVLQQAYEPFRDDGIDGLPDAEEPGYDAATNPDPNHDDYHWLENPSGTEKNWRYDVGEKFDDFGVDGVQGKGCTVVGAAAPTVNGDGSITGCYDYGEGNGTWDLSPNAARMYARDPHALLLGYGSAATALTDDALDQLATYYDAGYRDFLDDAVSTNSLTGALQSRQAYVRVFEGFPALTGFGPSQEGRFEVTGLDYGRLGRHVYVRYGDPDETEAQAELDGGGRHLGSTLEAVHRAQMLFTAVSSFWPGGDFDTDVNSGGLEVDDTYTRDNGRVTPYTVLIPPGYNDPANATKTYPVFYLLHGLGGDPMEFAAFAIVAHSMMVNDTVPAERRVQKMLIVNADGACRPGADLEDGPVSPDGDGCEEGTYFAEHPYGTYQGETMFEELAAVIESKYRVKAPADVQVVK